MLSADHDLASDENLRAEFPSYADKNGIFSGGAKIKLNEFYNLPECGLKPIVAERNTTLGKVQSPSQRYLYELKLIKTLNFCHKNAAPEQVETLENIIALKRIDLKRSFKQLILSSNEILSALNNLSVHTDSEHNHDFAIHQWQQLADFAPGKMLKNMNEEQNLEEVLLGIESNKTPARIWNDIHLMNQQLPQITEWLIVETENLDCTKKSHKTKVEYLRNVFNLFFIEKIQPQIAKLNGWTYKLKPIITDMYLQPDTPVFMQTYIRQHTESHFPEFKANIKTHVQVWQKLFKRCNVSPVSTVQQ